MLRDVFQIPNRTQHWKTSNKGSATLLTQFHQQSIRCSSDFLRLEGFGPQKTEYFTGIKLNLRFIEKCCVFMYYLTIMFLMDVGLMSLHWSSDIDHFIIWKTIRRHWTYEYCVEGCWLERWPTYILYRHVIDWWSMFFC